MDHTFPSHELTAGAYCMRAFNPDEQMLRVWRFEHAPKELQDLSSNGGDEDWVLLIPPGYNAYIAWAENPTFGCCGTDEFKLPGGWEVWIGCHA